MNTGTKWLGLLAGVALASTAALAQQPAGTTPSATEPTARITPEVPFVPTPEPVVEKMLELGEVGEDDVVYDLGSGDGRIVIAAAKRGAQGVGVDINPERIAESRQNAQEAGVSDQVKFIQGDLFDANLEDATVVTLYLLPSVNLRLKPKLLRELEPGTRIVSHSFDMDDWEPEQTAQVSGQTVYVWTVPQREKALKMAAAAEQALQR